MADTSVASQESKKSSKVYSSEILQSPSIQALIARGRRLPPLLPDPQPADASKICLCLDLDETLVHSNFHPVSNADFVVSIDVNGREMDVYVNKRPYVDRFLESVSKIFECILFTASTPPYAEPVTNRLDPTGNIFRKRLCRDACTQLKKVYVKDLARLGRSLERVAILDNSPLAYMLQPDNSIPIGSWFDDPEDTELLDLIPFLEKFARIDNVYDVLKPDASK